MALIEKPRSLTFTSLIGLVVLFLVAESDPNTNVYQLMCNVNGYAQDDPYANSVAYAIADLMTVTPARGPGFYYKTTSFYATTVCYGLGTCNEHMNSNDCASCLVVAEAILTRNCTSKIGGNVELYDCTMRYDNYYF